LEARRQKLDSGRCLLEHRRFVGDVGDARLLKRPKRRRAKWIAASSLERDVNLHWEAPKWPWT
jgi:hypothetical protein